MPWRSVRTKAPLFMRHEGVRVYHVFRRDDADAGVLRTYCFTLDPIEGSDEETDGRVTFDVRLHRRTSVIIDHGDREKVRWGQWATISVQADSATILVGPANPVVGLSGPPRGQPDLVQTTSPDVIQVTGPEGVTA